MKIKTDRRALLGAMTRAIGATERKGSMPILSHVMLSAGNALDIQSTDLYLAVRASVPAEVYETGSCAAPAKMLHDLVKSLPDGEVTIAVDANHRAELRAGRSKFRVPCMPADDFPPLPAVPSKWTSLDRAVLLGLIARTGYSMSDDDTRPHLSALLLEAGTARAVSTDGHRLSVADGASAGDVETVLIPARGVAEVKRCLDAASGAEVGFGVSGGCAFFRAGDVVLSVKLADESFPPYAKVIPAANRKHGRLIAPRDALAAALRRIVLVASRDGVRLEIRDGLLRVVGESPDAGEGSEELDVDYAGPELTIGCNARYLLDAIGCLADDDVTIEVSGELDPLVIKAADYTGVVMPMRV